MSATDKSNAFVKFAACGIHPEFVTRLLVLTWLACGLSCRDVRRICEQADMHEHYIGRIVSAYREAGGVP